MAKLRAILGLCLGLALIPADVLAGGEPCPQDLSCTDDFSVVYESALDLGQRYGSEKVLLVFDIDNTLLATDQALGSDQWFVWQWGLVKATPPAEEAVAEDREGLLRTQRLLFALSHMHPPQPSQPDLLAELQNRGFPVIALTARGHQLRDVTRRELARNGYDLARNALPPRPGFHDDPFLPYNPGDLSSAGLTAAEADTFGLGEPRPVSYRNGLYMTAGQHKGAMLRVLLNKTGSRFEAIVFLDDHAHNVRAVRDAFASSAGIELNTYLFTREAAKVAAFQGPSAKAQVTAKWERLEEVIADVFPSRAAGVFPVKPDWFPIPDIEGFRRIHEIQGEAEASPLAGQEVVTQGVVTLVLLDKGAPKGFFIQDPIGDADPATSEGLFVYRPEAKVAVGDLVRIEGKVKEFFGLTEILPAEEPEVLAKDRTIEPTRLLLPERKDGDLEAVEGMLVIIDQPMTITQTFFLDLLGQATLASPGDDGAPGPMFKSTQLHRPGSPEALELADENRRRTLVLDDGATTFNPSPLPLIGSPSNPTPVRAGDWISRLVGVVDWGRVSLGKSPTEDYRIHPAEPLTVIHSANPHAPDAIEGGIRVAGLNLQNFFNGDGEGGGFPTPRGARNAEELRRQGDKLVAALQKLDADIVAVMEVENDYGDGDRSAIAQLSEALNTAGGTPRCGPNYEYVFPGTPGIGDDVIAVGLLVCAARVGLAQGSQPAVLTDAELPPGFSGPLFDGKATNRSPLAVTFTEKATGETFSVAVLHLKSKGASTLGDDGSVCEQNPQAEPDCDQGDGQGYWNDRRVRGAQAVAVWLQGNPTGVQDDDILIIGDINAYSKEDPVVLLESLGYTNLAPRFAGQQAYSYSRDGRLGSLDHALASPSLLDKITGVAEWHINADEPPVWGYSMKGTSADYYRADPFRASDHDPIIIAFSTDGSGERPSDTFPDHLPRPPADLQAAQLQEWLRRNWYDGKHRELSYKEARRKMYSVVDVSRDQRVYGVYTGFSQPAEDTSFLDPINAEHTVPQTFFGKRLPMRSDIHHLFPTHKEVNSARGHDRFAEIPDATTDTWYGIDATGRFRDLNAMPAANDPLYSEDRDDSFEPPDAHKGDLARGVFYFYTMYPTQAGAIERVVDGGVDLLCEWSRNDPPDDWERQRNDRIEKIQGNRNPYVDLPALSCRAWGCACER